MNQILTDEEIGIALRTHFDDYEVFDALWPDVELLDEARAVESAVLAKVEPLLRRALFLLDVNDMSPPDDIDRGIEDIEKCAADIREVLGENE